MIDLNKFSKLAAFKAGSDCEVYANNTADIREFIANAEAEWLLAIAEEIGSQFIGFAAPVQNKAKYDEIRKKVVLSLVNCALLESDKFSDEQLDLLWVAEEWANGNAHNDDFETAFMKSFREWDWCEVRDYHLKTQTLPRYEAAKILWFVFRNESHKSLVTIMTNFNLRHNGKDASLEFKKECAEICRETLGELIKKYYINQTV